MSPEEYFRDLIGTEVVIEVDNFMDPGDRRLFHIPLTKVRYGVLVPSTVDDAKDTIRMTTGIRDFPERVIKVSNILAVNYEPFFPEEVASRPKPKRGRGDYAINKMAQDEEARKRAEEQRKKNSKNIVRNVEGSKGNVYTVTVTPSGNASCTCPQFIYRHQQCKHIDKVLKELENGRNL